MFVSLANKEFTFYSDFIVYNTSDACIEVFWRVIFLVVFLFYINVMSSLIRHNQKQ